jgi:hypothetical protein
MGAGRKASASWEYYYSRTISPLLDELAAVIDHVQPYKLGGTNDVGNLATSCNRCNMMKNNMDPKEWALKHPIRVIKAKRGEPKTWDGFSETFLYFAKLNPASLQPTEKKWLEALTAAESSPS